MKRSLMKEFNLLILSTIIIYIVGSFLLYTFIIKNEVNDLKDSIMLSNVKEISHLVDGYVQDELLMLNVLANTKTITDWLEKDEIDYFNNIESTLESFSTSLNVNSLFFVSLKSLKYYQSTRTDNIFQIPEYMKEINLVQLDEQNWFYNTLEANELYNLNIGKSVDSDELVLWVNIVIQKEGQRIGVMGCNMPIEVIVGDIIEKSVTKEDTYIIDDHGLIQLANDIDMIQPDSYKENYSSGNSIYTVVNDSETINEMERVIQNESEDVIILKTDKSNYKSIALAKIPIINWYVVNISRDEAPIKSNGLTNGVFLIAVLSLLSGYILIRFTRIKVLKPLKAIRKQVINYEKTHEIDVVEVNENEVGSLINSIIDMETTIEANQRFLEKKILIREEEVHQLYKDISVNEKNLQRLLNALPIGVIRFNKDLEIVYANLNSLLLFGVENIEEYEKNKVKCNYYPFISLEDKDHFTKIINKNEVLVEYRIELQLSYFRRAIVLINVYQVEIDGGTFYEGVMRDITKNIKYEKQLIKRANYDNLTGVLSRAAFISRLDEFLSYHYKESAFSYFVTFDFDYFKLINDRFGHQAGDYVLKLILDMISLFVKDTGIVGRIGGDEFALVVWDIHEDSIMSFLDQIRKAIEEQDLNYESIMLKITISLGYTKCQPDDNFKTLYYRSDQALYEAKGLGKNRICNNNNID